MKTDTIFVTLNSIKAVTGFVEENSKTDAKVRVHIGGGITVDGGSIMGLFSANLLEPLQVDITACDGLTIKRLLDGYDQKGLIFTEEGELL
ncbi:MAG: hypothetical protein ACI4CS_01370 [Candidatus Weimeria sp.]